MDNVSYNIATININNISSPTKIDALRTFVRTMELDIVFLQEVENDRLSLPGYNVVCNVDFSRRGTAIALKEYIHFSNVEKSLDGRLTSLRVNNVTLCNVYAHSGTAFRAERERFLNSTIAYYLRHNTPNVILAGDFNCVIRPCDATGNNDSPALKNTTQQLQLCDAWVKLCPRSNGHTYVTANSSSRLDRFYVSRGLQQHLRSAATHVCSFSDHQAVTLRVCLPSLGRAPGRGFWTLRPHLLTQENIDELRYRWQFWTRERRHYASWIAWWLSCAKRKLKSFFRWKSKIAYDEFQHQHQRLYAQLRQVYDNFYGQPALLTTINSLKAQMIALQRKFSRMFVRINETLIAGEELSSFHLGERARKRTTITQLRKEDDQLLHSSEDIEQHLYQYYSTLYSEEAIDRNGLHNDFEMERKIPENDAANQACMQEIDTAEILTAIKASASKKSPGPDGIPKEFYLKAFDVIHREINLVLNEALSGTFPPEFVDGVIVLVRKKAGDDTVRSYRPISLLNFDYKLLSRILKIRLEIVMRNHNVLSNGQKCANAPRNIFQAALSLKDRLAQTIKQKQRAKLFFFDLDSAFDRVHRAFLHHTMSALGFNQNLVDLLARIAGHSSSRLLINGHLSQPFAIQRSVRQGCPLSMHLFVIYLHPLVMKLERACGDDLVIAYADDITIICSSIQKIEMLREIFTSFELVSGAKLNWQKTKAIDIGHIEGDPLIVPWLQTGNTIKVLGVIFTNSVRLMVKLNWEAVMNSFMQQIRCHSLRCLTLHQRVIIANTFVMSKIWYLSSILPPYAIHTAKITSTLGRFLWHGIPTRIPMTQLARDRDEGGLKLQLPAMKCPALMVNRHIQELECMPFYKAFVDRAQIVPADLPDLKLLCQRHVQLPPNIVENPSANQIHRIYINQTDKPKVELQHPELNWKKIWSSLHWRSFTSAERSSLFMLVNEKGEYRKLLYTMQRADGENCVFCNEPVETLQHKYSECQRVKAAWESLQRRITTHIGGRRRISFNELLRPSLDRIGKNNKIYILKLFVHYISFVNDANNVVDVNSLNFHLNVNC